jgi:hypothetical protein
VLDDIDGTSLVVVTVVVGLTAGALAGADGDTHVGVKGAVLYVVTATGVGGIYAAISGGSSGGRPACTGAGDESADFGAIIAGCGAL